jgi:type IV pilus assembly protein PilC
MAVKIINDKKGKVKLNKTGNNSLNWNKFFELKKKISIKKKVLFYSDLGILLSSDVDIIESLRLIEDNFNTTSDKEFINELIDSLISGISLSGAMKKSNQFTSYEYYSIEIGEETGSLNTVMHNLQDYFKKHLEQRRKMISAFSYPVMVLLTAFAALSFMLGFVVPMFEDIFSRYGHELPWITQSVIDMSDFVTTNWYWIFMVIVLVIAIIVILLKQQWFNNYAANMILKIPFFGNMVKMTYLLRFFTAFELLVKSHTPMIDSLQLLAKMINFYPIKKTLPIMEEDVLLGKSLYEAMKRHPIFEKKVLSLVKISEHVNMLDNAFEKLKIQYTEELDHKSTIMGNILEPFLIIFVGLIVGVILISMYLPIFEFSSSFGI